mmetsp:Transcript_19874/g.61514  ORF Transcript_19874/g.61514 Transcript_19874/m.61514 type:complete len:207 (+) Transcript_19874:187-807(+)
MVRDTTPKKEGLGVLGWGFGVVVVVGGDEATLDAGLLQEARNEALDVERVRDVDLALLGALVELQRRPPAVRKRGLVFFLGDFVLGGEAREEFALGGVDDAVGERDVEDGFVGFEAAVDRQRQRRVHVLVPCQRRLARPLRAFSFAAALSTETFDQIEVENRADRGLDGFVLVHFLSQRGVLPFDQSRRLRRDDGRRIGLTTDGFV